MKYLKAIFLIISLASDVLFRCTHASASENHFVLEGPSTFVSRGAFGGHPGPGQESLSLVEPTLQRRGLDTSDAAPPRSTAGQHSTVGALGITTKPWRPPLQPALPEPRALQRPEAPRQEAAEGSQGREKLAWGTQRRRETSAARMRRFRARKRAGQAGREVPVEVRERQPRKKARVRQTPEERRQAQERHREMSRQSDFRLRHRRKAQEAGEEVPREFQLRWYRPLSPGPERLGQQRGGTNSAEARPRGAPVVQRQRGLEVNKRRATERPRGPTDAERRGVEIPQMHDALACLSPRTGRRFWEPTKPAEGTGAASQLQWQLVGEHRSGILGCEGDLVSKLTRHSSSRRPQEMPLGIQQRQQEATHQRPTESARTEFGFRESMERERAEAWARERRGEAGGDHRSMPPPGPSEQHAVGSPRPADLNVLARLLLLHHVALPSPAGAPLAFVSPRSGPGAADPPSPG